jgi:DNA polymerase III delta prime subunit
MAHHAYFITGDIEEGIVNAYAFITEEFRMTVIANPNVMTLRHGLLSVDDARRLRSLAELSSTTDSKDSRTVLVISASRLFHEAQNALLKLFEEPPEQTVLILVIPAEGMLLPTLRSRLLELPSIASPGKAHSLAEEFMRASASEREKMFSKITDRAKSDKDEEKQASRHSAIQLLEGLIISTHSRWLLEKTVATKKDLALQLTDLNAFIPILHERSAPLKQIFEHVLITYI